ncbi:hypothetical protein DE146DRAFT_661547 [Phaeosphaeria sp. MPI-PUGE-AT-0046c]|nr:hypothetical protein DE146DRAFT_661547 [Phaeosphaeria sp. MPI-PUGE-AT-0046c]
MNATAIAPHRQEMPSLIAPIAPPPAYFQPSPAYYGAAPSQLVPTTNASVEIVAGTICYAYPSDGNSRFLRCNVPRCNNISFARMQDFERHYNSLHALHPPQFWCTVPECTRDTPFPRKDKMEAHARTRHD